MGYYSLDPNDPLVIYRRRAAFWEKVRQVTAACAVLGAFLGFIYWLAWPRTAPKEALRVLRDQGYSEINLQGYCWACCGKYDFYADEFTAKSITGASVHGVVCRGGGWKGSTIRTF